MLEKLFSKKNCLVVFSILVFISLFQYFNKDHQSVKVCYDNPDTKDVSCSEYYITKDKQVFQKIGETPLQGFKNCTVLDIKNFSCQYDDKSATFGVMNGKYFNTDHVARKIQINNYRLNYD